MSNKTFIFTPSNQNNMKTLTEKQSNLLFRGTMIAILVTAAIIASYMILTGQYHTHTVLGA